MVRVSDTGIGIRDDKLRSIFGPYQQEAHSAMRSGGTGLGLCIAQQLAVLMKGSIQAEPKLPQGSVFQVLLPLPSVAEEKNQVTCESENGRSFPERFNSERILLVDDNPFNLLVAEELMKLAGLTVDTAEDGVEAVEMVRTKRYDLVLMDLNMPQMDGIEASVVIRGFPDCTDLPIIALTADANASTRQKCLSNGMNDVVTKPIDPSSFCSALTHWLPNKSTEMNKSASGETCAPEEALQDEPHVPNEPEETVAPPLLDNPVILQAFVHNHGKTVQRIHQALTGGEREEAHRQAHNLKSAAGAIGAPQLNRLCEELEGRLSNATAVNKDFEGDLVAQVGDEHLKVLERIARYQS
ncbi:MAG: response regulator [Candidatus Electrothrix sp. ATG1]|nr:response regulator [Candidatus Electrothrix sp. ATG1]